MPITYNGIGTHYYGKKNLQQRPGVCRQCGRAGNLQSYDTKLWFVIVFIPIIPLGRKHIIDSCPSCRRHYVADAHKWETARQLETSGAMDKFRNNPTPENGIAVHQQLLGFHQAAEAAEFQKKLQEQFADNAKIHAYLGDALSHYGQLDQASTCYQRALELRPDLPEARVGVARAQIRAGKLDEAQELLSFLKTPGAAQLYSLEPLEVLARAYQKAGRHVEALKLFGCLVEALPQVAQHGGFRKAVKTSEKALKTGSSILPKAKFSLRGLFQGSGGGGSHVQSARFAIVASVVAVIVGIIFVITNEYTRRHRTVFIVNGFGGAMTGEIVGVGPFHFSHGYIPLTMAEGHYHAHIQEPVREEIDFDIRSKYMDRWFNDSVWVINPRGAGIILFEHVVYTRDGGEPNTFDYRYGKTVEYFPDVSHPFTPVPQSLQLSSSNPRAVRTHIELTSKGPIDAFYALNGRRRRGEAIRLAKWRLSTADDGEMLQAWISTAKTNELPEINGFIAQHLADRPVRIELHRMYQTISGKRTDEIRDLYNQMLATEPLNPDLLYLRGRAADDNSEGRSYFKKALGIDPKHAYATYALAYDECAAARWETAKPMLDTCMQLQPDNKTFERQWQIACLATHAFEPLEQSLRAELRRDPVDPKAAWYLCETLIAEGKTGDAESVIDGVNRACLARFKKPVPEIINSLRSRLLYANADYTGLEKLSLQDRSDTAFVAKIWALVENGHPDAALKTVPEKEEIDPFFYLTLSLAADVNGDATAAQQWRAQATKLLLAAHNDKVAALLKNETEITIDTIEKLIMSPSDKAVLLLNLAQQHPDKRVELCNAARKFNVERAFPYHLIERATAIQ